MLGERGVGGVDGIIGVADTILDQVAAGMVGPILSRQAGESGPGYGLTQTRKGRRIELYPLN